MFPSFLSCQFVLVPSDQGMFPFFLSCLLCTCSLSWYPRTRGSFRPSSLVSCVPAGCLGTLGPGEVSVLPLLSPVYLQVVLVPSDQGKFPSFLSCLLCTCRLSWYPRTRGSFRPSSLVSCVPAGCLGTLGPGEVSVLPLLSPVYLQVVLVPSDQGKFPSFLACLLCTASVV